LKKTAAWLCAFFADARTPIVGKEVGGIIEKALKILTIT
jgi:hypothetical protein